MQSYSYVAGESILSQETMAMYALAVSTPGVEQVWFGSNYAISGGHLNKLLTCTMELCG